MVMVIVLIGAVGELQFETADSFTSFVPLYRPSFRLPAERSLSRSILQSIFPASHLEFSSYFSRFFTHHTFCIPQHGYVGVSRMNSRRFALQTAGVPSLSSQHVFDKNASK